MLQMAKDELGSPTDGFRVPACSANSPAPMRDGPEGGYLKKLLDNARVVRYLSQHCGEILAEFQAIVETKDLGTGE